MGQVIILSNDIDSTGASRFKQVGVVRFCQAVERGAPLPRTMEEILFGSLWNMIGLLLTTDDVVILRTVASLWNVGNRRGALLEIEQFEKMPLRFGWRTRAHNVTEAKSDHGQRRRHMICGTCGTCWRALSGYQCAFPGAR